ncbi:MAG: LPS-assembly protein LptD [Paracoccaceae bacterium]
MMRALVLALILLAGAASAQTTAPATLVADALTVSPAGTLRATGRVEAFHEGTRLTAAAVTYDRDTDRLTIEGPILIQGEGGELMEATQATLDPGLERGILTGARLVLDRRLQLAATRIDRIDANLTQLHGVGATSCQVCAARPPLWEIRASRVVHDRDARTLWFENAQFRLRGVPLLYLPRLRLPDPTVDRMTGLLPPRLRSTDQLGIGLKLPYFVRLGSFADATFTPYVSPRTRTLDLRYRQATRSGGLTFRGGVSLDDIVPGDLRGYAQLAADFRLPGGRTLDIDVLGVSDAGYLLDYGLGDRDLIESRFRLARLRTDSFDVATLTHFRTLQPGVDPDTLPTVILDRRAALRLHPARDLRVDLMADAEYAWRPLPDTRVDGAGRDVMRVGLSATAAADRTLPFGLRATARAGLRGDAWLIAQDAGQEDVLTRTVPSASATLRLPLSRTEASGARQLLEPVVQLSWAQRFGDAPRNDDSRTVDFDAGNLLSLSRFPGQDRVETGAVAALGLSWTRRAPDGTRLSLSAGRVIRAAADPDLTPSSGLSGTTSDTLLAGRIDLVSGLGAGVRTLVMDDGELGKSEARVEWRRPGIDLTAAYVFVPDDPAENRTDSVNEITADGRLRLSDRWEVSAASRYDLTADRPVRAAVGVVWRNECVEVDLSASRRFTASGSVQASTSYGLGVSLRGFSTSQADVAPRPCRAARGAQ